MGEPFDVLVSDLGLPDANGYEIMRHSRDPEYAWHYDELETPEELI